MRAPIPPVPPPALGLAALGLAALGLAALAACASSGPRELTKAEKLGYYLENALRYYDLRELDRAQHQVQQGLALDPRNERFLLMLGNIHQLRGTTADVLTAERIFRDHPSPGDYRVQIGLGQALERKGMGYDVAARAIRAGTQTTDAPDPEARADELEAEALSSWREAHERYLQAVEIHSGELHATTGLMRTSALLRRDEESIAWGRELIEVLEASSRVRRMELEDVAIEARRERQLRDAIRANTELIIKTRLQLASLDVRQKRPEAALEELGRVVELDPQLAQAFSRRAQLSYGLGRYIKAKDSIERYITLSAALPFDHPDIRAAYDLLDRCKRALADGDLIPAGGN